MEGGPLGIFPQGGVLMAKQELDQGTQCKTGERRAFQVYRKETRSVTDQRLVYKETHLSSPLTITKKAPGGLLLSNR